MVNPAEIIEILKNEYGITTAAELNRAIEKLGKIDISPFCEKIDNHKKEKAS